MHPYLLEFTLSGHQIKVPTYGAMLAFSLSLGYFVALKQAKRLNESVRHVENLWILVLVGAVVGMRMFHVLFEEPSYYFQHPAKIFSVWEGGYVFYGAVITCLAVMFSYTKFYKLEFLQYADLAATAVAIGLVTGRLGCFGAGCCWGRPTTVPWAVKFTDPETFAGTRNVPVHPTQLYEAFGALLIFCYLWWRFNRRTYKGQIFFHGITLYAILRFVIEYYRGDDQRGHVLGGHLSNSQLTSLLILPFSITGLLYFRKGDGGIPPQKNRNRGGDGGKSPKKRKR